MIYAITFNPSYDLVFCLPPGFSAGETYTQQAWMGDAGGKGNNVARAIKQLGGTVTAVGFYGGPTGDLIQQLLTRADIPVLSESIEDSSRICLTLLTEPVTEVRGQGPHVSREASHRLLKRLAGHLLPGDWVTISGSLPPGLSSDNLVEWIDILRPHCQGIIADVAGEHLTAAWEAGVLAICPNQSEYDHLSMPLPPRGQQHLIITQGEDGVLWHAPNQSDPRRIWGPPVIPQNPVGAGDVLVGALVYFLSQSLPWPKSLANAVATASASVVTARVSEIDEAVLQTLLPQIHITPADPKP